MSAADCCQHSAAQCRAFLALDGIYGDIEYVRHDLSPQRTLCAAAADLGTRDHDAGCLCHFKGITQAECHAFVYRLQHICTAGIHTHTYKCTSCLRIVVRRTLAHQVRKEVYMIVAQLLDLGLSARKILVSLDIAHPPLIAGCSGKHATHQVISAVCVCKGMQRILRIYGILIRRDEDRSAGSQGDVAVAVAYRTGTDRCCRIVAGTRDHLDICGQSQFRSHVTAQASDHFITFKDLRQPFLLHAADLAHLLGPLTVLYVKQKHTGSIGYIRRMNTAQTVCQIILRQHDLCDLCKVFRLVFLHPQYLRCGKTCECDITGLG